MKSFARERARRNRLSFVLLEVTVSLVILGVSMTAVLRAFLIGFYGIREMTIIETATLLAESLLEDYELEPPTNDADGDFIDDERFGEFFANYRWVREVDEEDQRYSADVPRDPLQDIEPLYSIRLEIWYDDGERRNFRPVTIETYMLDVQLFSNDSIQANQLF